MINSNTLDVSGTYFGPYPGYVECKLQAKEVLNLFKDTSKIKELIHNISHATTLFLPIVFVDNFNKIISFLKKNGVIIIGLSVKSSQKVKKAIFKLSFAIIMGSEKYGIKTSVIKKCNFIFKLKTFGLLSSINVAVATGIILYNIKNN